VEQICIAERGNKYPLLRSENFGSDVVEISFEGDECYIAAAKVSIVAA
jgi:hypothetical protein